MQGLTKGSDGVVQGPCAPVYNFDDGVMQAGQGVCAESSIGKLDLVERRAGV
jgi:hypothetical protein